LQLKHCALLNTRAKQADPDPELTRFRHALWKCNHPAGKSSPTGAGLYVRIADLTFDSNAKPVPLSPEEVCRGVEFVVRCTVQLLGSARAGVQQREVAAAGRLAVSADSPLLREAICGLLVQVIADYPTGTPAQADGCLQALLPALEQEEPGDTAAGGGPAAKGPAAKRPKKTAADAAEGPADDGWDRGWDGSPFFDSVTRLQVGVIVPCGLIDGVARTKVQVSKCLKKIVQLCRRFLDSQNDADDDDLGSRGAARSAASCTKYDPETFEAAMLMLGSAEASARVFYAGRDVPSGAPEFAFLQVIAQQHADALAAGGSTYRLQATIVEWLSGWAAGGAGRGLRSVQWASLYPEVLQFMADDPSDDGMTGAAADPVPSGFWPKFVAYMKHDDRGARRVAAFREAVPLAWRLPSSVYAEQAERHLRKWRDHFDVKSLEGVPGMQGVLSRFKMRASERAASAKSEEELETARLVRASYQTLKAGLQDAIAPFVCLVCLSPTACPGLDDVEWHMLGLGSARHRAYGSGGALRQVSCPPVAYDVGLTYALRVRRVSACVPLAPRVVTELLPCPGPLTNPP
jgi:hypothetical protein